VHNLVHREVLEPDGVTFTSHRASDETTNEFLASSDNWFRPTMLKTGPDGALYIADMYRLVIEHPEWIPKEMQARLDVRAGEDKGRLYRVLPEGAKLRPIPNLAKMNSSQLAGALDSPSGWQRDTVQRLILERDHKDASVPALEHHARSAKDAKVRVQALWTLSGLNALTRKILAAALHDPDERVREHALRLGEGGPTSEPFALVDDPAPRVRYQLAFTLGELRGAGMAEALVKLADDKDENIRNAALSSAPSHAKAMLPLVEKLPASDRARTSLPMLQKLAANPPALARPVSVIERTNALSAEQRAERAKVLSRYADVPKLHGDSKIGAALFKQHCAQCHRLRDEGVEIGPDLGVMAGKPAEQFVLAILDPNAAVESRYQNFSATMKDGHEVSGIIIAETPTTLTLRAPNRADETLLRGELKALNAGGLSLMPDGLESALTPQQLADLIAFVLGK
jgi:putative heme-binding domain-containing protein